MVKYQKAQATYDALIAAAAVEFWAHGVAGARIVDILNRAEISQGAMYHHFTTKFEVADTIVDAAARSANGREGADGSARGAALVAVLVDSLAESMADDPLLRAAVHIYGRPGVSADAPDPLERWRQSITVALQQAIADRDAPDTIDVPTNVQVIVDLIVGATRPPAVGPKQAVPAIRISTGVRQMLDGLRAHATER